MAASKKTGSKKWIIAALVVAALCAAVFFTVRSFQKEDKGDSVVYVTPVSMLMDKLLLGQNIYAGIVVTQGEVTVNNDDGNRISDYYVKEGDTVTVGTPLFKYDVNALQDSLTSKEIARDRAKIALESAQKARDDAQKAFNEADSGARAAAELTLRDTELALEEARLTFEKAEKAVTEASDRISNATVLSEIDGTVSKVTKADYGNQSSTDSESSSMGGAVITIEKSGNLQVKLSLGELDFNSIEDGMEVTVQSRTDESKVWTGTVKKAALTENTDSRESAETQQTNLAYVTLDNSDGMVSGQHVKVTRKTDENEDKRIFIDPSYIVDAGKSNPYVWADDGTGLLEKRKVELGEKDSEGKYEILSGLGLTDAIVLPSDDLKVGMNCKIGDPSAEASTASSAETEEAGNNKTEEAGNNKTETAGNGKTEEAGNEKQETGESSTSAV